MPSVEMKNIMLKDMYIAGEGTPSDGMRRVILEEMPGGTRDAQWWGGKGCPGNGIQR